uniref:hypothetical chloroplast RF47 n=1 Tax=Calidiella yingdensis TaxID=3031288 RepID=UPI0024111CDE|nr:hypothetical chloroplast RF47 [Calidiella yingdensis]WDY13111.1 hypothetical chloroplast RF47 [Calidiella yingdensis]
MHQVSASNYTTTVITTIEFIYTRFMSFRLFFTILLIVFLVPQTATTYYNYLVNIIYSMNVFINYRDVKRFVFSFSWICIFFFMFFNIVATF